MNLLEILAELRADGASSRRLPLDTTDELRVGVEVGDDDLSLAGVVRAAAQGGHRHRYEPGEDHNDACEQPDLQRVRARSREADPWQSTPRRPVHSWSL
jgi:hypothetical protein